jgi:hypothetical protein
MTVPPLFGWEHVLIAMVLVVLAAAVGLALLAAGKGRSARNEWQAWLDGRSAPRGHEPYHQAEPDVDPAGTAPQA